MKRCIVCNKQFDFGYPRTKKEKEEKFCSLECRQIFNRSLNQRLDNRICKSCGNTFQVAKSSNLKECPSCRELQKEKARIIPIQECEACGKKFDYDWRSIPNRRLLPRFCSRSCSNSFSSQKTLNKTKILICPVCNKEFFADVHSRQGIKCNSCKKHVKVYNFSQDIPVGKFERSGLYIRKSCSLTKLGFNFENSNLEEEFLKIQKLLITEYEINLKSADQIEKEYGLAQGTFTTKLLDLFNIEKREKAEIMSLAVLNNPTALHKEDLSKTHYQYQSGYHTDWEGKNHFLRSSYEFDLAKKLDERQIHYETEVIRIRYFDVQNQIYKTGVPDFYLPDLNLIIETKSNYFYNPEDLTSRRNELEKLGFKFYVYLDKEKLLENFKPLNQIDEYLNLNQILP